MVGDIAGLADGTGSLSVFTNEQGGIIDDTVVTKVRQASAHTLLKPDMHTGCHYHHIWWTPKTCSCYLSRVTPSKTAHTTCSNVAVQFNTNRTEGMLSKQQCQWCQTLLMQGQTALT